MPTISDSGQCETCGRRVRPERGKDHGTCDGTAISERHPQPNPHPTREVRPFDPEAVERPGLCEETVHEVQVKRWPPTVRIPASRRPVSVSGVCRKCQASVIVYDPPQEGIILILPGGERWGEKKAVGKA